MIFTGILVAINVLVFIVLSFGGRTEDVVYMVEKGALYAPYVEERICEGCRNEDE